MAASERVIVVDNGAGSLKVGFGGEAQPRKEMPNCIVRGKGAKKQYVADQVDTCDDIQALTFRRPFDRGYVVAWDTQKEIWDRALYNILKVKPPECGLLVTEPPFNLPAIQAAMDELVFEDYGFRSCLFALPAVLAHHHLAASHPASPCSLVLDSGFSFTHAVPVVDGRPLHRAVRRLTLGGKALTNFLKELVSYRVWNLMEETAILEECKQALCFVSLDVPTDLVLARAAGPHNLLRAEYVLPDGVRHRRGFVKDPGKAASFPAHRQANSTGQATSNNPQSEGPPLLSSPQGAPPVAPESSMGSGGKAEEQVLSLTNERFLVPEMLFHPADLGVPQAGLAECLAAAVAASPAALHPVLWGNVVLTGGCTRFPRFRERLEAELRPLVPDEYDLRIHVPSRPDLSAWLGGSLLAASSDYSTFAVTKDEYEELGSYHSRRKAVHC